ncbi:GNAT family N-acetyltransferase [Thalassospira sp.]|uniref:GNAT family N-acetyltransferase n=1 Tax=Thalassospira sp. TaxID=1912094 RepID=UPI000C416FD1|nr:GNAT family N-acetyltransferase [Thalassospira sp.]MBC07842.1 GNAT family N-acetyltransferase [Thalassospira sp.]
MQTTSPKTAHLRGASLNTERLELSSARLADIPDLYAFLGDRDAMRFTHCDESFAACRKRVLVHEWFRRRDGFAPWVVRLRETDDIIGWGGLYTDPFAPGWGPELGYYFAPTAWGQGFGRELANAALTYGRDNTSLTHLTAFAHPENIGSHKLLLGLGFEPTGFVEAMNRDRFTFLLRRG